MPQIEQLPDIFFSQLFWLLVVFGIVYFGIGRGMVPKIQSVVDQRDQKISADLAAAQRAREEAEETEEAYRERIEASRSEAMKLAQQAKQKGALEAEQRLKAIDEQIGARVAEAEARIQAALAEARRELEPVAAEAASQLVAKLTGRTVGQDEARAAVKAAIHG
jgi:F-type H+-transporting ATPase subunit b